MEFLLNKIDTNIRLKLQEKRKEGKVHSGKAINVNKDLKDEGNTNYEIFEKSNSKKKKYITITGEKDINEKLSIEVEKTEKLNIENSKGKILDAKK
ncbi:hypothetical protein [Clostridium sp.]|uniref:hypothetical protein n=1 Tax=Clostridium sp. TaxID=1506 RepID=UPI002639B951|nr:hypothetical protein [Clostridium sp.]